MTINKAQGQTLGHVGAYLPKPTFGHCKLYFALSRCSNTANLKILIKNGTLADHVGTYTRNVVYKEILTT